MTNLEIRQFPKNEAGLFYGYLLIGVALLIMSVIWAAYYTFGVFFKPMLEELGWTRAMTAGAFSIALVINGLLAIAMGGFTDKFGPRMVMTICGLLLGLGYFLISQISAVWHLYLSYGVLVGAGMGGSFIPLISTVARWFVKKRNLMTGIVASGTGIGALIGPPVANRLISTYGWRVSYTVLGCVVFLIVILFAQFLKREPAQVGKVAHGVNQEKQKALDPMTDGLSLKEAVYASQFWVFFGTGFCYGFCLFAVMVHIAPHVTEFGISATDAANILATIGGLGILGKVLLGRIGDIIGSRQTLIFGFILMSVALFWLVPAKMVWMLFSIAGIFGFAYGGCTVSQSPLVAELFGLRSHGLIFGVFGISVTSGGALGPLLTGYIFDFTGSYHMAFLICAFISFTGIILSAVLKQRR